MITREKARLLRRMIEKATASLSDTDALEAVELFPLWKVNTAYEVDKRVKYENKLYRVVQDITPALYTEVALPGEIPVWRQPTGAQDAYMTGDKVYYPTANDSIYVSTIDNNTWAPDVYGWTLFNE